MSSFFAKDPHGLCFKKGAEIQKPFVTCDHIPFIKNKLKEINRLGEGSVLSLFEPYLCQCPDVNWLLQYQLDSGKCLLMQGTFE